MSVLYPPHRRRRKRAAGGVEDTGDRAPHGSCSLPTLLHYTAIGNQVNLAARVQARCSAGDVLITHATWALVRNRFACEPRGEISVRAIHYPVKVYAVRGEIGG